MERFCLAASVLIAVLSFYIHAPIPEQPGLAKAPVGDFAVLQAIADELTDLQSDNIQVLVVNSELCIRIPASDMFKVSRAELSKDAAEKIAEIASRISLYLPSRVRVEGHTTDDPTSTPQYPNNWYLSAARAIAVGYVLTDAAYLEPSQVTALGMGSSEPIYSEEEKDKNSRVEIYFVKD
jgi:chemotaxis protein MotB